MRRSLIVLGALAVLVSATGVAFAALVECQGGRCEGTDRPDRMVGSDQRDAIFAFGNRDQVDGEGGADDIHGGDGGDDLCGQEGADYYGGSTQGDLLVEGEGSCTGQDMGTAGNGPGSGPDRMFGGRGADLALGAAGNDRIHGNDGADSLGTGELFIPSLSGDDGDDLVSGGERGDSIAGGEGEDRLLGNRGNDFINSTEEGSPLRRGDVAAQGPAPSDPDFVDCGPGFDEAVVNPEDDVANCERVRRQSGENGPFSVQRAIAAFRAERGR